jgi:hypothetical protein
MNIKKIRYLTYTWLLILSGGLLPQSAFATDTGIIGSSGKQGQICSACHAGGSYTSSIAISGSTSVDPGSTSEFSVLMTHNAPFAGFNLATDVGDLQASDSLIRLIAGELTHLTKRAPASGVTQWDFQWTAPDVAGDNTFWVCGLAVDGNGTLTNDDVNPPCITLTVNVQADTTPAAIGDSASVDEDNSVTINVISNDTDTDGNIDAATVTIVSNVSNGSTSVNSSGVVTYTPTANYNGSDSFSYTVKDNDAQVSNTATVAITVNSINDAPTATNDTASTNEDSSVAISILSNDSDVEGSLSGSGITITSTTSNGSLNTNTSTGSVTYTPNSNYNGTDSFSYRVTDSGGLSSNTATVTITVTSVNDNPIAANDSATTNEDETVSINLLANDTDSDGTIDSSSVSLSDPAKGTASIANGTVTYIPGNNFNGSDSLTYTVKDNNGGTSNSATVSIEVNPVNDPPIANDDSTATEENTPVTLSILSNDSDVDSSLSLSGITITIVTAHGITSVNNASGTVTYTPDLDFNGTDSFEYTVKDAEGLESNTATVSIVVRVNQAPVANDDSVATDEDIALTINVLSNDTDDLQLDSSTVTLATSPTSGSAKVNSDGTITYTPLANTSGSDSLSYSVKDSQGASSNIASVSITVNAVNDLPVFTSRPITSVTEDQTYRYDITVSDIDNSSVNVSLNSGPSWLNLSNKTLTGTPSSTDVGPHQITLNANDGTDTAQQTFTVTVNARTDADLSLTASLSPSLALVSQPITLTYTLSNAGPADASNVTLSATLSGDVTLSTSTNGCSVSNSQLNCTISNVPANQNVAVTAQLQASNATDIVALGQISFSEDLNNNNNRAMAFTSAATTYAQGGNTSVDSDSRDVAIGDINGDGFIDAIYINATTNDIYFNNGDGQLTSGGVIEGGLNGAAGQLFDLDNDGDLDLVVANQGGQPNQVYLNTNAVFSLVQSLGGSDSRAVTISDLNGDDLPDIVFANVGTNTIFANNGDNRFSLINATPDTDDTSAVVSGDMNGDGALDLVFTNSDLHSNYIAYNTGDFTFNISTLLGAGNSQDLVLIDVNNDNLLDVVIANRADGTNTTAPANWLYTNMDNSQFSEATAIGSVNTLSVSTADFNNDNFNDLVFINEHGAHQIYTGNGNGSFNLKAEALLNEQAKSASVVDLNSDGSADLIYADNRQKSASVFINNGDGTVSAPSANLELTGGISRADAIQGMTISFSLTVSNPSNFTALNSTLVITLPTGVNPTSGLDGCEALGSQQRCTLGDITSGQSVTKVIVGNITLNAGQLNFAGTVSSDTADLTSSNNSVSLSTLVHTPPVANDDSTSVPSGSAINIDVLANDTDDGSLAVSTVSIVTAPANGRALIEANGTITYTSNTDFVGSDTVTYSVLDNFNGVSNTATVTITVTAIPVTPPPVTPPTTPPSSGGGGGGVMHWLFMVIGFIFAGRRFK